MLPSTVDALQGNLFLLNNYVGSMPAIFQTFQKYESLLWALIIFAFVRIGAESWLNKMTRASLLSSMFCTSNVGMPASIGFRSS